jgi:ribosome-binding protein aMBF1 (putative translation factor)
MEHQDWSPITIRSGSTKLQPAVKAGSTAVPNRLNEAATHMRKIEETEVGKLKTLTSESKTALVAGRVAKKLTQKELDMRGSFPANSTNGWESGRVTPSRAQIQSLQRILGVKLDLA